MKELTVYGPFISRKQAIEKGLTFYFTGKPCSKGHISRKYVKGYSCFECTGKGSKKYAKKLEIMREENAKKIALKEEAFLENLPVDIRKKIITREEAIAKGLNRYFTGKPCQKGHLSERDTSGHQCITCKNENQRRRRSTPEGKDKQREEAKKRWANTEQRAKQIKAYKDWKEQNPERVKVLKRRDWYKHHEKNLAKSQAYERKRYKEDPVFRLRMNLPKQIRKALINQGNRKENSTRNYIGCNISKLKEHIEDQFTDGMTWANYSKDGWHLDHIRPCASFDLSDKDQIKICFNWRNLQPLWSLENTVKRDRYTPLDEVAWVERMISLGYEGELFLKYEEGNSY